jgi:hypothetical protein
MVTETMAKFQRELNSLQRLSIINVVFGGLAMSFGVAVGVQNILAMVQAQSLLLTQLVLVTLGFLATAISLRWVVSSAELLDSTTDMKDEYTEKKKTGIDDEGITGLIVKMMVYYRENKPTIKTMMLISRIAGVCFLISGAFNLATALINFMSGVPQLDVLTSIIGAGLSFTMAAASLVIPHFFSKYSKIWDYRLEETVKAEKELKKRIEESEE